MLRWRATGGRARGAPFERAQHRPDSHVRNNDFPVDDLHRAPDQEIPAIQATAYLAGFYRRVALRLENNALAVLEFGHALGETCPFGGAFHRDVPRLASARIPILLAGLAVIRKEPRPILSTASEPQELHRPCISSSISARQLTQHHCFLVAPLIGFSN